ncbi:PEP-CTERM sorting domain-containing protein [Akkermansiaceae bacterium]|nr:PEP-CTERM sorting domain-containing protein [Akkermansiaceae bacterium]
MKLKYGILSGTLCSLIVSNAGAATISWGTSVAMYNGVDASGPAAEAFVSTAGTFVLGINGTDGLTGDSTIGGPNPTNTVNGVAFTNINGAGLVGAGHTNNGVTINSNDVTNDVTTGLRVEGTSANTGTPYGSGSIAGGQQLHYLLEGGIFGSGTVSFSGLTIGQIYSLQILTNDARGGTGQGGRDNLWQVGFGDGVTGLFDLTTGVADADFSNVTGVSILNNRTPSPLVGEQSGNYITGTFTADATTQDFDFLGTRDGGQTSRTGTGQINALQLRAIPEPSSVLLTSLAALGFIGRRRR